MAKKDRPNRRSSSPPPGNKTKATEMSDKDLDLGKLNRHWYRRCLDDLGESLQETGSNPTVEELETLCHGIVTSFLEAVTSQAPDSNKPQFPADRAFFIPFEEDRAGRFNFAKPYYQLLEAPRSLTSSLEESELKKIKDSLWSFLPWFDGEVEIDFRSSTNRRSKTIRFEEMISPRKGGGASRSGGTGSTTDPDDGKNLRVRRSLLLPTEVDGLIEELHSTLKDDGDFHPYLRQALAETFVIYKTVPGKPHIELILLNQIYVLRWLAHLSDLVVGRMNRGRAVLSMQRDDFKNLLPQLLRGYFLLPGGSVESLQEKILEKLELWIEEENQEDQKGEKDQRVTRLAQLLYDGREALTGSSEEETSVFFFEILNQHGKSPDGEARLSVDTIKGKLLKIYPHFTSFHRYFLKPDQERTLEQDLEALMDDDPRRAGKTESSFVWVCPDFEGLNASLPSSEKCQLPGSDSDERALIEELEKRLCNINRPYRHFFRRLERSSLVPHYSKISNYWRTRGDASRSERLFASFKEAEQGMEHAPKAFFSSKGEHEDLREDPFPQNIFLRVRICDSLNEPVIDGLFIFSTDYDEVRIWDKRDDLRREDTEDLLSFSKVFFFIVRDYIHGLDRAREAADIGRLNQHLFDKRLRNLEETLERQLDAYADREEDLTKSGHWNRLVYDLFNNYADALIDKPPEVRNETFPYDRLLVLPLAGVEKKRDGEKFDEFNLPFYLFQSIFIERKDGKVQETHYSLVKPFQSPIEQIDAEAGQQERFNSRTFQKEFESSGLKKRLPQYLEKHYVGAQGVKERNAATFGKGEEISSLVIKAGEADRGRDWAVESLRRFWEKEQGDDDVGNWCRFLSRLTADYRDLTREDLSPGERKSARLWFLFRFGLLRSLLREIRLPDKKFLEVRDAYARQELRLKFADRDELDILWLAGGLEMAAKAQKEPPPDIFRMLAPRSGDSLEGVSFVEYALRGQDPLTLSFFQFLTDRVSNRRTAVGDPSSWYQPLLTLPIKASAVKNGDSLAEEIERVIGKRTPRYDFIQRGDDGLAMFLGVVDLQIGRHQQEAQQLRCLIAVIRDFDDSKIGLYQSEEEIREHLRKDLRDLELFTSTFFQNAQRTFKAARERQQVRVLSTDIQQIARNWYSKGMDDLSDRLQRQLQNFKQRPEVPQLNQLRPEMLQCLFEAMTQVLLREERNRNDQVIPLESFPFDRVLHIPLLHGSRDAACLSYARTVGESDSYERIRREGRHAVLGGGRKKIAGEVVHVGLSEGEAGQSELVRRPLFAARAPQREPVRLLELLELLEDPRQLDAFVRRLYQADALQTLTLTGILVHLVELAGEDACQESSQAWEQIERRILEVLRDSVRSVEQLEEKTHSTVRTEVTMDRAVHLPSLVARARQAHGHSDEELRRSTAEIFQEDRHLPFLADLFQALEGGREEWQYGLVCGGEKGSLRGDYEGRSKLFHVFYSIPAPEGFLESFEFEPQSPRYRGIFCFVVDDAATDDKDETTERADQEDIRTFVHNAMSSLRLVLDQQSLENRLLQPGVEQFVNGMLHRLKNELNEPVSAFWKIEKALRALRTREAQEASLLQHIRAGQEGLNGVHHIFQKLKGFSESQRGVVPLQNFSSDGLGWLYVESLCSAALKEIGRQAEREATQISRFQVEMGKLLKYVRNQRIACEAPAFRSKTASGNGHTVQKIKRTLHEITELVEEFLKETGRGSEFLLSYDVFSTSPLLFRGSYQLPEALNILIENAFQAAWGYLREAAGDRVPGVVKVGLVCHGDEKQPDEILLEIENSSRGLDPEFEHVLNAVPPQPISTQRYSRSGGKKQGGSGFGHYFARRIISEFCGGRDARRRLDARIQDLGENLTQVRVNLLAAREPRPHPIHIDELLGAAVKVFDPLRSQILEAAESLPRKTSWTLPDNIEADALMQSVRTLLEADRQLKENGLCDSLARDRLCRDLKSQTEKVREGLERALASRLGKEDTKSGQSVPSAPLAEMRLGLTAGAVRREAFHDLQEWLVGWNQRAPKIVEPLIRSDKKLHGLLRPLLESGRLEPVDLLTPAQKKTLLERFELFRPYLHEQAWKRGLEALFDDLKQDVKGRPVPNRETIISLLREEHWGFRAWKEDGRLRLGFLLSDTGNVEMEVAGSGIEKTGAEAHWLNGGRRIDVLKEFPRVLMAYTFAQYQSSIAELDGATCGRQGGLVLVRQPGARKTRVHDVTSRAVYLELGLESAPREIGRAAGREKH